MISIRNRSVEYRSKSEARSNTHRRLSVRPSRRSSFRLFPVHEEKYATIEFSTQEMNRCVTRSSEQNL